MANLSHLFSVGQEVVYMDEGKKHDGVVSQIFSDHIIVNVPSISDHLWFEEGFNIGFLFPKYNF